MTRLFLPLLGAAVVAAPLLAQAPAPAPAPAAPAAHRPLRPVVEFGIEFGGDKVATVTFTNGEQQSVRAGQGGTLAAGVLYEPSATVPVSLRATVGFKFQTTAADNVSIWMRRYPVELVGSWHLTPQVRVGAGYVRHLRPRFTAEGLVPDIPFADGNGATVELAYSYLALTWTAMKYRGLDANAIGATLIVPFGK